MTKGPGNPPGAKPYTISKYKDFCQEPNRSPHCTAAGRQEVLSKQELRGSFRNILELLLASYTGLGMHASAKEIQTVSMMGGKRAAFQDLQTHHIYSVTLSTQ